MGICSHNYTFWKVFQLDKQAHDGDIVYWFMTLSARMHGLIIVVALKTRAGSSYTTTQGLTLLWKNLSKNCATSMILIDCAVRVGCCLYAIVHNKYLWVFVYCTIVTLFTMLHITTIRRIIQVWFYKLCILVAIRW